MTERSFARHVVRAAAAALLLAGVLLPSAGFGGDSYFAAAGSLPL